MKLKLHWTIDLNNKSWNPLLFENCVKRWKHTKLKSLILNSSRLVLKTCLQVLTVRVQVQVLSCQVQVQVLEICTRVLLEYKYQVPSTTTLMFNTAKLPTVALPNPWHCQKLWQCCGAVEKVSRSYPGLEIISHHRSKTSDDQSMDQCVSKQYHWSNHATQ